MSYNNRGDAAWFFAIIEGVRSLIQLITWGYEAVDNELSGQADYIRQLERQEKRRKIAEKERRKVEQMVRIQHYVDGGHLPPDRAPVPTPSQAPLFSKQVLEMRAAEDKFKREAAERHARQAAEKAAKLEEERLEREKQEKLRALWGENNRKFRSRDEQAALEASLAKIKFK